MAAPLLQVQGLTKRYGTVTAVDGVSFSIVPGEILGVIGPNGSGKTTLFECIAGVRPADSGSVQQQGHPLSLHQRHDLIFYLPDSITPWPAQPVGWVLDYAIGLFRGRAKLRSSLIDSLQLSGLLTRRMEALSKGERKRVLLAVGLLTPQPILIADEPFDGLDLRQAREVTAVLREHARERSLLLSIHQISDAARVCDRFVLLSGGKTCGEGTLAELSELAKARGANAPQDLEEVFLALT